MDPQMERQVETIRNLVDSYMNIIGTTIRDVVPKVIMFLLVARVRMDISGELIPGYDPLAILSTFRPPGPGRIFFPHAMTLCRLFNAGSPDVLLEESPEEQQRREEILSMYNMAKKALAIICMFSTNGIWRTRARTKG
jgi:dynamin GTPase